MLKMALLSAIIVVPIVYFDLRQFTITMQAPLILGTAISIFLGFRTNSAYDRWFQGRALWGDIGGCTRNTALLCSRNKEAYTNYKTGKESKLAAIVMPRMIKRSIALMWIFNKQLKDLPPLEYEGLDNLLEKEEKESLAHSVNPSLQLLFNQGRDFRIANSEGQFVDGEHFEFVAIQREMALLMTRCNGLKNTRFPTHYTYFTDLFVWLLVALLSMSLPGEESAGYWSIPIAVLIGWIFSMIEGIGNFMDHPWTNNRNVVPMDFLTRSHEIEIRSFAFGDTDLPPAFEPVDGALY